jgi:hypothetical protein
MSWMSDAELDQVFGDSCAKCGGDDHVEDTCPEFTSLEDYETFMRHLTN